MLEYDKIDTSEDINVNKSSYSKECGLCHYWYFLDKNNNNNNVLIKYPEIWTRIRDQIKKLNNGSVSEWGKDYRRIKFNSNDILPLNKLIKFHGLTIVIRSIFENEGYYYPQIFLDECLYEI